MRNKKLFLLNHAAKTAFDELSAYLEHLDKREGESSYSHARMLFDEGWRLDKSTMLGIQFALWMASGEDRVANVTSTEIQPVLDALQLTAGEESNETIEYLAELTFELGDQGTSISEEHAE